MNKEFLKERYYKHFGESNNLEFYFCPYRICPLGAHSDHQHGYVSGFAINYGIYITYEVQEDSLCTVVSHNFKERKRFSVVEVLEKKNDWADYIRGATVVLQHHKFKLNYGVNAYIYGEIPTGGLSSSAAVIIAFMNVLAKANGFTLTDQELIDYSFEAETEFVGMNIGKLDQSCEVLSKKNKLLVLDTSNGKYEVVEMEKESKPFKLLVIHSGAERKLASTSFNLRVDELRAAGFTLLSYENANKEKFKDTYLRYVPKKYYIKHGLKLPDNLRKRAEHFYTEFDRVLKGKELWRNGDIEGFGKLVLESGRSSIVNYESGSPLLIDLYNIIATTKGVYGGRFMGGGFNGACLAIINPEYEEEIMDEIKNRYGELHPDYKEKMSMFICTTEDGVGM